MDAIATKSIITDEIAGNVADGANVINCSAVGTTDIIGSIIADEVTGDVTYGSSSAIINRSAVGLRMIADKVTDNVTNGAIIVIKNRPANRIGRIITDKITGNVADNATVINCR